MTVPSSYNYIHESVSVCSVYVCAPVRTLYMYVFVHIIHIMMCINAHTHIEI